MNKLSRSEHVAIAVVKKYFAARRARFLHCAFIRSFFFIGTTASSFIYSNYKLIFSWVSREKNLKIAECGER
jgi:hypothetical protein